MAQTWNSKLSAEDLAFELDFSSRLGADTISTATLAVVTGAATFSGEAHTGTVVSATFAGGTPGETCVITCQITTAAGFALEEIVILPIAAQEAEYADQVEVVYQTAEDIDRYMVGAFGDNAAAWLAADAHTKQRAATAATRLLDRQAWAGRRTAYPPTQTLAFPRIGLCWPDGGAVPSTTIPRRLLDAACELAAALVNGSTVQDTPDQFQDIRSVKAGPAELVYFRRFDELGRFPQAVQELIGFWLGGPSFPGSMSSGTQGRSIMEEAYDVSQGF